MYIGPIYWLGYHFLFFMDYFCAQNAEGIHKEENKVAIMNGVLTHCDL
jgi:hypothetical protein